MAGIIVAYFSRSGTCEAVAKHLAQRQGADLEVIQSVVNYNGGIGALRGAVSSLFGKQPLIVVGNKLKKYDRAILVAPIWAGRLAPPAMTWISRCLNERKSIELVTVASSTNAASTVERMKLPDDFSVRHILHLSRADALNKDLDALLLPALAKSDSA